MHVCYQATRNYVIERRGRREEKRGKTGEKGGERKREVRRGKRGSKLKDWEPKGD